VTVAEVAPAGPAGQNAGLNHDAFVRAIAENPHDAAPWLVYADYPDEQGKPHTAALMRTLAGGENRTGVGGRGKWKSAFSPAPSDRKNVPADVLLTGRLGGMHAWLSGEPSGIWKATLFHDGRSIGTADVPHGNAVGLLHEIKPQEDDASHHAGLKRRFPLEPETPS
jgi:uncharacterized protein (TIGR02996 family)